MLLQSIAAWKCEQLFKKDLAYLTRKILVFNAIYHVT